MGSCLYIPRMNPPSPPSLAGCANEETCLSLSRVVLELAYQLASSSRSWVFSRNQPNRINSALSTFSTTSASLLRQMG